MIKLNKRGKIVLIIVIAALTAVCGYAVERYDGETFTQETITMSESDVYYTGEPSEIDGKININAATAEELELLDGIGEKLAERIVNYREENGAFSQTEGIMLVPGIGEKMYEDIKDDICVQ